MENAEVIDQVETIDYDKKKIFKERAISVGTFLGGPLVAGYMFAENFKALGDNKKANRSWLIAIGATLLIIIISFLIPANSKFPSQIIPIAYTLGAIGIFKAYLSTSVNQYLTDGGQTYGWGRVIVISLIGLAIILGLFFAILYQASPYGNLQTKVYGPTQNEITYNPDHIYNQEVDMVADALFEVGFFDNYSTRYVYTDKTGKTIELSISIESGYENDSTTISMFKEFKKDLGFSLAGYDIVINLVVDDLENIVKTIK